MRKSREKGEREREKESKRGRCQNVKRLGNARRSPKSSGFEEMTGQVFDFDLIYFFSFR